MPRLKTLYHTSPENVNVLRPRYSPKFGMKGLFVSSKPSAMQNSWVGWASSKDRAPGRRDLPYHKRPQGSFKTITLYTLSLPMEDYQQAVRGTGSVLMSFKLRVSRTCMEPSFGMKRHSFQKI